MNRLFFFFECRRSKSDEVFLQGLPPFCRLAVSGSKKTKAPISDNLRSSSLEVRQMQKQRHMKNVKNVKNVIALQSPHWQLLELN